jgi:hypothetical protein
MRGGLNGLGYRSTIKRRAQHRVGLVPEAPRSQAGHRAATVYSSGLPAGRPLLAGLAVRSSWTTGVGAPMEMETWSFQIG